MAGEAVMRAALIAAGMLAASAPAQQPSKDVIVTARPQPLEEVVRRRVRTITQASGEQVARFTDPVCAGAIGLPEPYAGRIAARIMADAQAAGIAVAGAGCRPNITVAIVDDGKGVLDALYRRRPGLFSAMPEGEVSRAIKEPGPARVVTVTQLLSRDGRATSGDQASGNTRGPLNGAPTLVVDQASILMLTTRQDITGSLVLIDTPATLGKTLNQLADYAAMRTLAKTRARATADEDTILSLFAPGTPPRGLTGFDTAFLRALYRGPATTSYATKVNTMTREIVAGRN